MTYASGLIKLAMREQDLSVSSRQVEQWLWKSILSIS